MTPANLRASIGCLLGLGIVATICLVIITLALLRIALRA